MLRIRNRLGILLTRRLTSLLKSISVARTAAGVRFGCSDSESRNFGIWMFGLNGSCGHAVAMVLSRIVKREVDPDMGEEKERLVRVGQSRKSNQLWFVFSCHFGLRQWHIFNRKANGPAKLA